MKKKAPFFIKRLVEIYFMKRVARSAAELSYFLTLSIFPTLICLYAMLGNLLPSKDELLGMAEGIVPEGTLKIFSDYIGYISSHTSTAMLTAGLIVMATSSAAAFRALHSIIGDIQGQPRFSGFFAILFSFLFSLIFLAVIYFSVIVVITGNWFIEYVEKHLPFIDIAGAWVWIRFILLFLILLVIVYGLYRITAPRGAQRPLAPGALVTAVALVAASMIFSWLIGMSTRYPLVYGSLASIIVLMFWEYTCGIILIMGSAVNAVLRELKGQSVGKGQAVIYD